MMNLHKTGSMCKRLVTYNPQGELHPMVGLLTPIVQKKAKQAQVKDFVCFFVRLVVSHPQTYASVILAGSYEQVSRGR